MQNAPVRKTSRLVIALRVILIAAVVAGIVFFALVRMVTVPTGAMKNTIQPVESLLATRFAGTVGRGDLVIFKYPLDQKQSYLKRVVGLPGEDIEIRQQKVFINGKELPEERAIADESPDSGRLKVKQVIGSGPYRVFLREDPADALEDEVPETDGPLSGLYMSPTYGVGRPYRIPNGHYFVMGDNRENSLDSRFWGTVPAANITGKPLVVCLSINREDDGREVFRWDRVFTRPR